MSTDHLLRPEWARPPATADGPRPFDLPAVGDAVPAAGPPRDTAWATGYRDGRSEGYRDGHADGMRRGLEDGRLEAMSEAGRVLDTLAAGIEDLRRTQDRRLALLSDETVALALEVAELVIGHHVAATADPGAEALSRALDAARPDGPVVAHLHPDDLALLGEVAPGLRLEIVADASVGRGGCRLEAGPCRVDATVEGALDRIRAVLVPPEGRS